jgi:hypothetical protein
MQREITSNVVRHIDTSEHGEGMVIYSHLETANAEKAIREQVAYKENFDGSNYRN